MEAQAGRQAGPRARAGGGVYGYADVDAAKSGSAKQWGWRVQWVGGCWWVPVGLSWVARVGRGCWVSP